MPAVLAVLVALLLLSAPGVALCTAIGLRGWATLGCSVAVTLGYTGAAVTLSTATGIPWNLGYYVAGLAVLVVVFVLVARPWRSVHAPLMPDWRPVHHGVVAAAVLGAGGIGGAVIVRASAGLSAVPQGWDAIFHVGAIRQIADSSSADPASLAAIAQPENTSYYYPDTLHALAALAYQATSLRPEVVFNAFTALTPLAFTASIALLAMVLSGRPAVTVAAAGVSVVVAYFPHNIVRFGPLWPFGMAIAVAPALIAILVLVVRHPRGRQGLAGVVVLGLCAAGVLNTHASVAFAFMTWGVAQAVPALVRRGRSVSSSLLALMAAGVVAFALIAASLGPLRATAAVSGVVDRDPFTTPGDATGQLLDFSWENPGPQRWLAVFLAIGVVTALVRRYLLPPLLFAIGMAVLFVLSAAVDSDTALTFTSFWWDDPARFAALFTVPAVPLIAAGGVEVVDVVTRLLARIDPLRPRLAVLRPALAIVLIGVFLVTTTGYLRVNRTQVTLNYSDGPKLSTLEVDGLAALAEEGGGGAVMNDPFDGSSWGYALFGLDMVFPTPITIPVEPSAYGPDRLLLQQQMDQLDTSQPVQEAVRNLDIRWVVVSEGFISRRIGRAPGLDKLDDVRSLELVYDNPDIRVYRVNAP